MQSYVCTVGTVRSPFMILLGPECCVIKLACTQFPVKGIGGLYHRFGSDASVA